MTLRLIQLQGDNDERSVAASSEKTIARRVRGATTVLELAQQAITAGATLEQLVDSLGYGEEVDTREALQRERILPPIDHPDAARVLLSGTGLTHLGSAEARDKMHASSKAQDASDSLKMFHMGVEGGKPAGGKPGVQPEWFFKGDGRSIVGPEKPLASPDFALNGGEEPEIAGIYLIARDGRPFRIGYALANEFSDHTTERMNYLYLAHSKLRPASLGPELLVGKLPADIRGMARIRRGGRCIWERPFLTGEANMSHHLANLEHHHFKYPLFRRPGDVHVHFYGTATLSYADGVLAQEGDVFEIEAPPFELPLRNPLKMLPTARFEIGCL